MHLFTGLFATTPSQNQSRGSLVSRFSTAVLAAVLPATALSLEPNYNLALDPGSVASAPAWAAHGAVAGDGFGSIVEKGDLNGDGIVDLIVVASEADPGSPTRTSAGAAYVWFGKPGFGGLSDVSGVVGTAPDVTIIGASNNDRLGSDAFCVDLNADGFDDLVLGAASADGPDEGRTYAGEVYVIYGRSSASSWPTLVDLAIQGPGGADVTIYGANGGDNLTQDGGIIACDLDDDGIKDLVLSASWADGLDESKTDSGEVYVIWGRTSANPLATTLDLGVSDPSTFIRLFAEDAGDRLGHGGQLGVGDFNGDGVEDLLVGAPGADGPDNARSNAGQVFVLMGAQGRSYFAGDFNVETASPGNRVNLMFTSPTSRQIRRHAIKVADVNGDSIDDIILGESDAAGPLGDRARCGRAYVVMGRSTSSPFPNSLDMDLQGSLGADVTIYGPVGSGQLTAQNTLYAGDVNGDGASDILVGAPYADEPNTVPLKVGKTWLLDSHIWESQNLPVILDLATQATGLPTIYGASTSSTTVRHIAHTDLDGDGQSDLLLKASSSIDLMVIKGRKGQDRFPAKIELGNHPGIKPDTKISSSSLADELAGEQRSFLLADLNGDGVKDIVLGSSDADGPTETRAGAGAVYVILGEKKLVLELASTTSGLLVNQQTIAFPPTPIGDSSTYSFVLKNTGTSVFNNATLQIGGPNASNFQVVQPLPAILNPGEQTTFQVRFLPNNSGGKQATLTVVDSVAGVTHFTLPLVANYYQPPRSPRPFIDLNSPAGSSPQAPDVRVFGAQAGDGLARSGVVLDLNGDGFKDLALVSRNADIPQLSRAEAGAVYVWFGSSSWSPQLDGAGTTGALPDVVIAGSAPGSMEHSAFSLKKGDLNGDSLTDLMIVSFSAALSKGEVYVIWGNNSVPIPSLIDLAVNGPGGADVTIRGALGGDLLGGNGEVILDDFNGDNVADIVIGSYYSPQGGDTRNYSGKAFMIFGRKLPAVFPRLIDLGATPQQADVSIRGPSTWAKLTINASINSGDVTGDGLADLVLGASGLGTVYVIPGRQLPETFPPAIDLFAPPAGTLVFTGATTGDELGAIANIGLIDINGDGVRDLLLGAPYGDGPLDQRFDCGEINVFFGGSQLQSVDLRTQSPDVFIYGGSPGDMLTLRNGKDHFDMNGDGINDLVISAYYGDGPDDSRTDAGDTHLILGRAAPAAFPPVLDLGYSGPQGSDAVFSGAASGDMLYHAINTPVDLNADGYSDLVLSSVIGDAGPGLVDCGLVYVIYGSQMPVSRNLALPAPYGADVRIQGAYVGDKVSWDACGSGDFNGDSHLDLLLGAYRADGPGHSRVDGGEAYLIFGQGPAPLIAIESPVDHPITGGAVRQIGQVAVGGSVVQQFAIRNWGGVTLQSLSVTKSGDGASQFALSAGSVPATLSVNGKATFEITFNPTTPGVKAATITVASNDPAQPALEFEVRGNGLTPLTNWRQSHFGVSNNDGNADDLFDFDHDGMVNIVEYAFGLDPKAGQGQLPAGQLEGQNFVIRFTEPAGVTGVTYGADRSYNLGSQSWQDVPDTGVWPEHIFSVPINGQERVFMKLKVTPAP